MGICKKHKILSYQKKQKKHRIWCYGALDGDIK